ncbi:unnamed protein product [Thlaspi arvense]|uniref:Jacalin-type lectin domain-containing protein n=1 Tax=Thlaspi arvense TaxID=13288 RepID=A0AAU9RDQ2_THLAR|nr:unnamed protein product [Thlaspi arvense]
MNSETRMIKVGPAGRYNHYYNSPQPFDLKGHKEISQIFVSGGDNGIASIQFQYVANGKYELSGQYGFAGNTNQFHTIELNHPAEYITGVDGLYTDDYIKTITFTTNIQKYGPFGITNANLQRNFHNPRLFTYNLGKSSQFGGFHGTYTSNALSSIGFYLSVKTTPPNSASKIPKKETHVTA